MTTSNKILTGLFLLPIVILGANYGALYVKYKKDDYTTQKDLNEERLIKATLPSFNRIDLGDYRGEQVHVQHGAFEISYDKTSRDIIRFEVSDNTLYIKTTENGYHGVSITCPSFTYLSAGTRVNIDSMYLPQCTLDMHGENARLNFQAQSDTLFLTLQNKASFRLEAGAAIRLLHLEMENHTAMTGDPAASIGQFGNTVISDSADLQLDGKTFRMLLSNP